MVEIRENNNQMQEQTTPETITTSMILEDLENGVDRNGIKDKYNLQAWEVKQMFDHPVLKGKKAKRVKKLSFTFVDDTVHTDPDILPGQTNLLEAIDEEEALEINEGVMEEIEGRKIMDAQDQISELEDDFITDEIGREVIDEADVEEMESRADDWSSENNY